MAVAVEKRVEKLLEMAQARGMVVERVLIEGQRIEVIYSTGQRRDDADLIDWTPKR